MTQPDETQLAHGESPGRPDARARQTLPGYSPGGRWLRIGETFCRKGLITHDQLEAALKYQQIHESKKRLGEILVELNLVESAQVVEVLAESVGIPYSVLAPEMIEPEALGCLPQEFLKQHNLLPLSVTDEWLTIAVEKFTNVFLVEDIGRRAERKVRVIAAEAENIRQTREAVCGNSARPGGSGRLARAAGTAASPGLDEILDQIGVDDLKIVEHEQEEDDEDLIANAADSPVVKLVNFIIQNAVDLGASDVHIEPDDGTFRVRYRVDGELIETVRPTARLLSAVVSRIKIMGGMDISERRIPQDGSVTVTLNDRPIDLRLSTMATKMGEKVVMRIVDRDAALRDLDSIGFEPGMLARFRAVVHESNGIVLVTGPTGSGKTTTLYAALAERITEKHNISTIEDPIERRLPGTNQFQVHAQAGFTFANALRSLLRQDPDIIMVGEIRDAETARLATEAALTGHLVLSTLHTNDAPTAIPRLINMGVEPYLVAASLRGVLAQRLVRRICRHCRKVADLSPAAEATLAQFCGGQLPIGSTYVGAGCDRCREAGSIGRIGIFELLLVNEEILSAIVRNPDMRLVREIARRQGTTTLLEDGLAKVRQGLISVEGLLEIVSRTEEFISVEEEEGGPERLVGHDETSLERAA